MWADCECTYCGHQWTRYFKSVESKNEVMCTICNDKNIKLSAVKEKIDYYAGSPPFPDTSAWDDWSGL